MTPATAADALLHRRQHGQKLDHARVPRLGTPPRPRRDAVIKGIDFPLHAEPAAYREAVGFIEDATRCRSARSSRRTRSTCSALATTFSMSIDPHAALMDETSCLSKRDGKLVCHAKDPISSGLALDGFLPARPFRADRRGGVLDRCRRLDHRVDLAPDATRARGRHAVAHRCFRPQPAAARRDPSAFIAAFAPMSLRVRAGADARRQRRGRCPR